MWLSGIGAARSREVVAYWEQTFGELVKSAVWKKELQQHGWFDAYADSATFRKALDAEEEIYAQILADIGLAKGPKQ